MALLGQLSQLLAVASAPIEQAIEMYEKLLEVNLAVRRVYDTVRGFVRDIRWCLVPRDYPITDMELDAMLMAGHFGLVLEYEPKRDTVRFIDKTEFTVQQPGLPPKTYTLKQSSGRKYLAEHVFKLREANNLLS